MRLFIAINFPGEVKSCLTNAINKLKTVSLKGNFSKPDHLHLTLVFIGETQRLEDIKRAMDALSASCFTITIGGLGKFSRPAGQIHWVGVKMNEELSAIYRQLYENLKATGFKVEDRTYKPHITLGREIVLKGRPDFAFSEKDMRVNTISLMKSERLNGQLVYSEIYTKQLKDC